MTMFDDIVAFLARAYPGVHLTNSSPFFGGDAASYRRLVAGKEKPVANELTSEPCWLVTLGPDPQPWLPEVEAIEKRDGYHVIDYGMEAPAVLWIAKLRGHIDLDALRANAGPGLRLLIAPKSERMIEHATMMFCASSAADLARAVAAHPESFKSANVR